MAHRNGRKEGRERRSVRAHRTHVQLEKSHPLHIRDEGERGGGRGELRVFGRSHTYARPREGRASENFYDTLAAFMSRVNLANSASFAPRDLSSFLGSLAAKMHCRARATR